MKLNTRKKCINRGLTEKKRKKQFFPVEEKTLFNKNVKKKKRNGNVLQNERKKESCLSSNILL